MCIDTSVLIYWAENHPVYASILDPLFSRLDKKRNRFVTSTITMLEVLVKPYRESNTDLVNQFYAILVSYPGLEWIDVTLPVADQAAHIRAVYNLRTPDSIQAATALLASATGLIGNDPAFEKVADLETLTLSRIT